MPVHRSDEGQAGERVGEEGSAAVRALRRGCLDHLIVLNEAHLRAILTEFIRYYNVERPHRSLHLEPPVPPKRSAAPGANRIRERPVLGGLHHVYQAAA